jgi:diacylglycerol kinase (ATP)
VAWVMDVLDDLLGKADSQWPPIAVLPLGTGNDLSRQFMWGNGYYGSIHDVKQLRAALSCADTALLDRWHLDVKGKGKGKGESKGESKKKNNTATPAASSSSTGSSTSEEAEAEPGESWGKTFINYFGLGVDGKIVSRFEACRKLYPWLFCCRCMNNALYGFFGFTNCCMNPPILYEDFEMFVNGVKVEIPKNSQGIISLNIQSFMGGAKLWTHKELLAHPHDGKLAICSVGGAIHLGLIKVGMATADNLIQGSEIVLRCDKDVGIRPAEVDGEHLELSTPGVYTLSIRHPAVMLLGPITTKPACDICC